MTYRLTRRQMLDRGSWNASALLEMSALKRECRLRIEIHPGFNNADGKPISIPYLADLEHDWRKPSDEVLVQLAKTLKVESDALYVLAGRVPADLTAESISGAHDHAAAWNAFRRELKCRKRTVKMIPERTGASKSDHTS